MPQDRSPLRDASLGKAAAYTALAPYYDRILAAGYDYSALGRYVAGLISAYAPAARSILELGAGSCPLAGHLAYPSHARVVYSDLSPAMLAASSQQPGLRRVAADATALPFRPGFDVCVMLMDALNYLLEADAVSACLGEAFAALRPGGIFIVNIAGDALCRELLSDLAQEGSLAECDYAIRAQYDPASRLLRTGFTFRFCSATEGDPVLRETHTQRIHTAATIRELAGRTGFEIAAAFDGQSHNPAGEASREIHFVLVRKA